MLTRWLTFTVFLAGSANPERAAITVAPTCRVKGHPEEELTLKCGDGKSAGVVQYWHTPFGDLQTPGFHSNLDPVFMHHDGNLVVPNASVLHNGLYYCILQHTEGSTLWPYKLHVSHDNQKTQENGKYEQRSSFDAFRFRRDVGSDAERQEGISDGQFAGAVAASVLLTFVVGFSAGALTRTHVLSCLGAVTTWLRSPRNQRNQTDPAARGSEVTMTTLPPTDNSHVFEMEQEDDSFCASMETTMSSTTSSPPAKPKRSFRHRREEEQETTAYLEGCDYVKVEERRIEEGKEVARSSLEETNKGCDGETEEEEGRGFHLLGEDEGSRTETDKDECSEGEERDGRETREEKKEWRQEKQVEEADEQENRNKEGGEERGGSEEEEAGNNKEKGRDEKREEEEVWRGEKEGDDEEKKRREEDGETDTCCEDGEAGNKEPVPSPPCPARRSRVIRLYQYDDDGQRYGHLPEPAPEEPVPAPRLKQRSLSLTRLTAIMAAASAGPLDTRETGKEKPNFQMEI